MNIVYLLLGSNQGDRVEALNTARQAINERIGETISLSLLYESEAWGFVSDNFINQVICVKTDLLPKQVLDEINRIEAEAGRIRTNAETYQARLLDIDILFYNDWIVNTDKLVIPHPRLHERRFTLEPLNTIAPKLQHPIFKKNIEQLLQQCTDSVKVWIYKV